MSVDCTFYDEATTAITRVSEFSQETLRHYAESEATFLINIAGDMETQYVVDGALVDFTPEELAAKRAMPPGWVWLMPDRRAVDQRTLAGARADKVAEISQACGAAIVSGFVSAALGAEHRYPAKPTDQTNLAGSIIDSLLAGAGEWATPFWCADAAGAWDFRLHTAAQIQQVGRDGKTAILAAMTKNEGLRAQIMAASIAEIDTITW